MVQVVQLFTIILVVQLFYASAVTIVSHTMPEDAINYVNIFSDVANEISLNGTVQTLESSVSDQTDMPLIELGALVFYSGNLLVDLLLNFAFAIPQMLALIINGVMMLFNGIDVQILAAMQAFFSVLVGVLYFVGIIQLLMGVRSGRIV